MSNNLHLFFGDARLETLDPARTQGLQRDLAQMAEHFGIATPAIYRSPAKMANMVITSTNDIIVSDGLLKLAGATDLQRSLPASFKSVIAHEMQHLAENPLRQYMLRTRLPWMMPLAAVGAVALYDAMQQSGKKGGQGLADATEAMRKAGANTDTVTQVYNTHTISAAHYLVAGALGLGGGLMASRHISRGSEFRADAAAVHYTNDMDGYIALLQKLHTQAGEGIAHAGVDYIEQGDGFIGKLSKQLEFGYNQLRVQTIHAHPSLAERVAAIRKLEPMLERGMGHVI